MTMPTPRIDGTITFGNIITLMGFLFAAFMAYSAMAAEQQVLRADINSVKTEITKLTDILVTNARLEAEITELRRRLDRIDRPTP
jgi:regulator of replication initiation timing